MAETQKGNKLVRVPGYTKRDGTKVHAHDRSTPRTSRGARKAGRRGR
jgi:hypothetical protein